MTTVPMFPTRPCQCCPPGTCYNPFVAICRECKKTLFVTCPHDGYDESTRRCSLCTDRIFGESTTCFFHRTEMHYFCMDCGVGVCSRCLIPSESHGSHRYQLLGALYSTRLKQVICMLNNLSITISNSNEVKKQVARNLTLVEANELEMLADLDELFETARECIRASADWRKAALKAKLAVDFTVARDQIEKNVYSFSKYELIQQHGPLMQALTNQMFKCCKFAHQEVDSYGFECPLIPQMSFATIRIDNINKRKSHMPLVISDSSGFLWSVVIGVHPMFTVQLFAKDETLESFTYRVAFEIVHRDLTKTLRRSCMITNHCDELVLANVEFLRANGFTPNNVVELRIGIRGSSIIVENEMLKLQQGKQDESFRELEESSDQNICCSSFFHLRLAEDTEVRIHSEPVTDAFGNRWCLRVKRGTRNVRSKNNTPKAVLGVYIVLLLPDSPTQDEVRRRCRYFIIIHNRDPSKRLYTSGEEEFSATEPNFGRNTCVDMADLTERSGFLFQGSLRFQFGVTPITSNGTVIEVAHFNASNKIVTKTILK